MAERKVRIMIMGLGSVGSYLLDYLMSTADADIELYVAGRNSEKMLSDINIVRVASAIRGQNRTNVILVDHVDLNEVSSIAVSYTHLAEKYRGKNLTFEEVAKCIPQYTSRNVTASFVASVNKLVNEV